MAPQLAEVWDENDDWTGTADPQERRKRQNRLHQRAHRRKRHLKRLDREQTEKSNTQTSDSLVPSRHHRPVTADDFASVESQATFTLLTHERCPEKRSRIIRLLVEVSTAWSLKLLRPDDLPSVARLNAFDALARNAQILAIPAELLESDDDSSPFLYHGPELSGSRSPCQFPRHLSPTALQKTIKHHPWLDLLPIPKLRDNILRGIELGILNEDQLCQELVCDLLDTEATEHPALTIWGDSWDIADWEFSPAFFRKWNPLIQDIPEVWQATNYWRSKRNARSVEFVLNQG